MTNLKNNPSIKPNILIVDDDKSMREFLQAILKTNYNTTLANCGKEAIYKVKAEEIDLVLLDIRMPDIDGLKVLKAIKEIDEKIEVIMITVIKDISTAVTSIKFGAYDYINKDFNPEEINKLVARAIEKRSKSKEIVCLNTEIKEMTNKEFVIGKTQKMKEIVETIEKTATLPATILITGDSGTGKELMARHIHKLSPLSNRPLVTVNIAAIPDDLIESTLFGHEKGAFTGATSRKYGKCELADGGTLFLDEIGELKYELQSKLLRFLQNGEIERVGASHQTKVVVRVIAATNINLKKLVDKGLFREDLYYRLNVIPIKLPRLSDRKEDIPILANLFINRYCIKFRKKIEGISKNATNVLKNYNWPGNIRELENLIERLVATKNSGIIEEHNIPIEYRINEIQNNISLPKNHYNLKKAIETFERDIIIGILDKQQWHQGNTSKELGIHRKTLEYKIKKFNIHNHISKSLKNDS